MLLPIYTDVGSLHTIFNLLKMKGLIVLLFCALTFVTVVYGKSVSSFIFCVFRETGLTL